MKTKLQFWQLNYGHIISYFSVYIYTHPHKYKSDHVSLNVNQIQIKNQAGKEYHSS